MPYIEGQSIGVIAPGHHGFRDLRFRGLEFRGLGFRGSGDLFGVQGLGLGSTEIGGPEARALGVT